MPTGTGICAFLDWTPAEQAEADRLCEQERRREAQAEQYAQECQDIYDKLEVMFLRHLKDEARAVNAAVRIKPADKKIFEQFKHFCTTWTPPLPALPAHPASVAAFIVQGLSKSGAEFARRLHAISRVHLACGLEDPARDVLLKSLVLKFKTPTKEKVS